jgi:rhomboid family GlyGly-CTERM serine protease
MITKRRNLLRSLNADGAFGWALLGSLALLALPGLGGGALRAAWRYDRVALQAGQWWRWLSAHFVHLDVRHLAYNLAGLTLLWFLFARAWSPRRWLCIGLCSLAGVDLGLWYGSPTVGWYVGASGALHGFWAAGAVGQWHWRDRASWLPLVLLALKLGLEQWRGQSVVLGGLPVVLDAHIYGALGGALLPAWWRLRQLTHGGPL